MTGGSPERDAALAGEYALRLLLPDEEAAVTARVARDPDFAALVERWRSILAGLDAHFEEAPPPARVKAELEARLFGGRAWSRDYGQRSRSGGVSC